MRSYNSTINTQTAEAGKRVEPTSMTNENFRFMGETEQATANGLEPERLLQSPVESHFAVTPVDGSERSSPANGFVSKDSTDLLNKELDQLETPVVEELSPSVKPFLVRSVASIDSLLSPMDENISMFSIRGEADNSKTLSDDGDGYRRNVSAVGDEVSVS